MTGKTWHVFTDGSAICHQEMQLAGRRYPGGWAAVVEHGSDGFVLRGRELGTTNVRMELRAAIEGLKQVPVGDRVVLHFDCTAILSVRDRWARRSLDEKSGAMLVDGDLWLELQDEFVRLGKGAVVFKLLGSGPNPVHRRAHGISQTEAKAARAGLPANATVLSPVEKKERRKAAIADVVRAEREDDIRRRKQVADFAGRGLAAALAAKGLVHLPGCEPEAGCVQGCPVARFAA